jgi:SAM-dependent methyltransferase
MSHDDQHSEPSPLIRDYFHLFRKGPQAGPVLDLACGDGRNGIFLAMQGLPVVLCDVSEEALDNAGAAAERAGVRVDLRQVNLEQEGIDPFSDEAFGAIVVFRYLHRPLIPCIKKALTGGGLLIYETFTLEQPRFGKPRNPDFLLKPGELQGWFSGWNILHYFEGIKRDPDRAIAQIVCRKPEDQEVSKGI